MIDLRKAAEKVLQENKPHGEFLEALDELRQALSQPEQEPLAYYFTNSSNKRGVSLHKETEEWQPLYTAPPKRGWVGLTDDEFTAIARKYSLPTRVGLEYFKDELEAKLKEKNT